MSVSPEQNWVSALAQRYARVVAHAPNPQPDVVESLTSLQFADALLKRAQLTHEYPKAAKQLAILGPTQSGKSTLVNILLDSAAASQSALAGFTVHAQGYAQQLQNNDLDLVQSMMDPLQRVSANTLTSQALNSYVLETTDCNNGNLVGSTIVWDTPDFDSISATSYELCVLKVAALADAIMLVVSKDKYADQRVWDILELVRASGKPLVICVNKVDTLDMPVIDKAIDARWQTHFGEQAPMRVLLPFVKRKAVDEKLSLESHYRDALQNATTPLLASTSTQSLDEHAQRFIKLKQSQWLTPLVAEFESRERWQQWIEQCLEEADEYYAEHYLNNDDKYETFNRALAELLTLLEIPGLAPTLTQARKLITWPARKMLGIGRQALGQETSPTVDSKGKAVDQEQLVLQHLFDKTITKLQSSMLESNDDALWQLLSKALREQMPELRQHFEHNSELARKAFEPQIDAAAAKLYEQLETQPALLNTLRAARATADAAGIALAVKSGGLAPTDLILAPAMLSVTTLLTESALGRYLDSIKRDLQRQQRVHIREQVLNTGLKVRLEALADNLDQPELLADNLEATLVEKIRTYARAK